MEINEIINKNVKLFYELLDKATHSLCPECKDGFVKHIGSEWTGKTWIEVYECNNCHTKFI
jgi:hypothetical protein